MVSKLLCFELPAWNLPFSAHFAAILICRSPLFLSRDVVTNRRQTERNRSRRTNATSDVSAAVGEVLTLDGCSSVRYMLGLYVS